jgi:hypothetical protein
MLKRLNQFGASVLCTLRAQWISISAVRTSSIAYGRISRSRIAVPRFFLDLMIESAQKSRMIDPGQKTGNFRLISTKTYTENPDEQAKSTKRERKIHTVRPAGLKTRRSFIYTIIAKKSCYDCAVALCTMQNVLLLISNLP